MTWQITSYVMTERKYMGQIWISKKSHFSTWWQWPLTYDLDLQTHMRYWQCQTPHQILGSYVKRFSRELNDRQTHRQTHGHRRDRFYTLDRWGGRDIFMGLNHAGQLYILLSRASGMGSPTNHPGSSDKTRGHGILWSVNRWTKPNTYRRASNLWSYTKAPQDLTYFTDSTK